MIRRIRIEGNTAYVPLTQGREATIDAADARLVEGFNWHAAKVGSRFYARRKQYSGDTSCAFQMHRVILDAPPETLVDHINGNGLDNRRSNLRVANPAQNRQNMGRPAHNTSGLKGASWCKRTKKWQATISANKKQYHLGRFATPEEAHAAYCDASARLHGVFGKTE